jgi:predicted Zn-dependent protease
VQSINVLTVNAELENAADFVKVVEDAKEYFPKENWQEVRYFGKVSLDYDFRISVGDQTFGAFLFGKLVKEFEKIKDSEGLMSLLLGITPDPVVASHYFFDGKSFRRAVYIVHDFVGERVGVVSFFRVTEESASKVVAHGLGHNRGLRHHVKPSDIMYSELLRIPVLQVDGFCRACMDKLRSATEA